VPRPLSLDLRTRIVHCCQAGELTQSEIADLFQVHLKTVEKYWKLWRTTLDVTPRPHAGGTAPRLAPIQDQLRAWTAEQSDRTLAEWVALVQQRTGLRASLQTMSRALRRLGLPLKKRR
jgi:transposase